MAYAKEVRRPSPENSKVGAYGLTAGKGTYVSTPGFDDEHRRSCKPWPNPSNPDSPQDSQNVGVFQVFSIGQVL